MENNEISKKRKYRKEKPWANDPNIDKWKMPEIKKEDIKCPFLYESSFSILFPKYREKYIKECFTFVKKSLKEFGILAELDLIEGSLTVRTTNKTFDPYIIIKARDIIKLIARSVPYDVALRLLNDDTYSEVIKIKSIVKNKEKFVKRRQRLIGPNGETLKALEILLECYIMVQGSTVSVIGHYKKLKIARRVIIDTMENYHPIYHIKELMIRKEIMKNNKLKDESWDRFLPNFKKINEKRKKIKINSKEKNEDNKIDHFKRKIDKEMDTGEYFLSTKEKLDKQRMDKFNQIKGKKEEKFKKINKKYVEPSFNDEIKKEVISLKKREDFDAKKFNINNNRFKLS